MEKKDYLKRVERITFEQFKEMAKDETLTSHEKIGFPDSYRESYAEKIFADIAAKLPAVILHNKKIADIGCGCDDLACLMIKRCVDNENSLCLIDSQEMLSLLPPPPEKFVRKLSGKFPRDFESFVTNEKGTFDAIIAYSVIQYMLLEDNLFSFIDRAVELLVPGGRLLLGDLPNRTKRKRFFLSQEGIKTHRKYTGDPNAIPKVDLFEIEYENLDDAIVFAILQRYRSAGMETYLLPQADNLPMANRREDILIVKRD